LKVLSFSEIPVHDIRRRMACGGFVSEPEMSILWHAISQYFQLSWSNRCTKSVGINQFSPEAPQTRKENHTQISEICDKIGKIFLFQTLVLSNTIQSSFILPNAPGKTRHRLHSGVYQEKRRVKNPSEPIASPGF
jgi:hypothetical protein